MSYLVKFNIARVSLSARLLREMKKSNFNVKQKTTEYGNTVEHKTNPTSFFFENKSYFLLCKTKLKNTTQMAYKGAGGDPSCIRLCVSLV